MSSTHISKPIDPQLIKKSQPTSQKRRVVVTGRGAVTPLGKTAETTWKAITEKKSGIKNITLFNASDSPIQIAGEIQNFDPTLELAAFVPPKDIKRYARFIQFALLASYEAYKDSGLPLPNQSPWTLDISRDKIGCNIGVGMGGLPEIEEVHKQFLEKGYRRISPFFIPQVIPNLASGQVSILLGLRGPNLCTVTACASSAHSIGESFRLIESGEAEIMVAGGAESTISPLGIGGFAALKALSSRNSDPQKASRPYDRDRDGFVMSEGATVLVLESLESALKRNAKIYGEVLGFGASGDAFHMTAPSPEGEGGFRAMQIALNDAGLKSEAIDYVNAHSTSTPAGDIEESHAIARMFQSSLTTLHVSSTKSMTGHLLGAAGAIESFICLNAIRDSFVPCTLNLDSLDPALEKLGLNFTPLEPVKKPIRYALSNSFGFGGTNATLIFGKYE